MREVTVSRFVAADPAVVRRALGPAALVEYEGSFDVLDVEERDDGTYVTAGTSTVGMVLRFEDRAHGYRYEQEGDAGPFDAMWTEVAVDPEDEGARVTATSGVTLGLPFASLTDRLAAWKRRGELDRALAALADDVA
jgi:carbon monoxide dehydrogenase subunit G